MWGKWPVQLYSFSVVKSEMCKDVWIFIFAFCELQTKLLKLKLVTVGLTSDGMTAFKT